MSKEFLTYKDMCERYGVQRLTVNNWRKRGIIPPGIKIGRIRRWNVRELEAWEAAHE